MASERERDQREVPHFYTKNQKIFPPKKSYFVEFSRVRLATTVSSNFSSRQSGGLPRPRLNRSAKKKQKKTKPAETPKIKEEKKDEKVKSVARWEEDEPGFEPGLWSPFFLEGFQRLFCFSQTRNYCVKKEFLPLV